MGKAIENNSFLKENILLKLSFYSNGNIHGLTESEIIFAAINTVE